MLGRDHALSGALVFAALGPSLHMTGSHLGAGVLLATGAGVLPDVDHPDSPISREFGFLTEAFAWLVDRLSGGHRHGTHSLVGIGGAIITCYTRWDLTLVPIGHWHVPLLALAVALGCAAHIAGDELTHGGCPLFWPVSGHEFRLVPRPLQITTAKLGENWIIFPLLVVALFAAVWHATGHPLLSAPG